MDLKYEKLLIWQKAKEIYLDIQKKIKTEKNDFIDKINESALKTMDCIAEGYEIRYDEQKIKKYLEALGYNTRTINMLTLAKDLGIINTDIAEKNKMTDYGLINSIIGQCIDLNKIIYQIVSKIKRRNELTTYNEE